MSGLGDLAGKAEELAKEHPDQVKQGVERAGQVAESRAAGSAVSGSFAMDHAMTLGWLRSLVMSSWIAARWAAAASAPITPGPKVRAPGSPMFPRLRCRPTAGASPITSRPCRSA